MDETISCTTISSDIIPVFSFYNRFRNATFSTRILCVSSILLCPMRISGTNLGCSIASHLLPLYYYPIFKLDTAAFKTRLTKAYNFFQISLFSCTSGLTCACLSLMLCLGVLGWWPHIPTRYTNLTTPQSLQKHFLELHCTLGVGSGSPNGFHSFFMTTFNTFDLRFTITQN